MDYLKELQYQLDVLKDRRHREYDIAFSKIISDIFARHNHAMKFAIDNKIIDREETKAEVLSRIEELRTKIH